MFLTKLERKMRTGSGR